MTAGTGLTARTATIAGVWRRRLRAGTAVLRVTVPTPRCVMISHASGGLPRDRELLRAVHREAGHDAGVYAAVEEPGVLRPGDRVELLP